MTQPDAHAFWQDFCPPEPGAGPLWSDRYAAAMPDGSCLWLPLRDLGDQAVAGLIVNQASFTVMDRLIGWMAGRVGDWRAEIVVGLPTLGHGPGQGVARALGHANWVAPGTTRKLWYDPALSVPTHSVTAPADGRRLWLDPRLLPRLRARRVLLIDDVISTGASARAGVALLAACGVRPVGVCAAMLQGNAWERGWDADIPVTAAFASPYFARAQQGWVARAESWPRGWPRQEMQ